MDPQRAIPHEDLLQQMGWVQALARSLVRDPNLAEDIAQQAWLTALERPPRSTSGPPLRAWLASVTRTLARQSARSENRRSLRERRAAAARPAQDEAALDVVARGEQHQDLVGHVLALDEPYRSVILLRYLDGLSGPEIAARCGASHAAVRKRLSRGLGLLRGRLDAAHGGDSGPWLTALLLPLIPETDTPGDTPVDGTLPGTPAAPGLAAVTTLGLLVVTVTVLGWWSVAGDPEPIGTAPRPGAIARPDTRAVVPSVPTGPALPLDRAGVRPEPLDTPAAAFVLTAAGVPITGRLLDDQGRPLADVRVRYEPDGPIEGRSGALTRTAFSDDLGRFAIPGVAGPGRVLVASDRWVTLVAGDAGPPLDEARPVVVAAPAGRLTGRVLDESGRPIAAAQVQVLPPVDLIPRLAADLAASWPLTVSGRSDAEGRFQLDRWPRAAGARLRLTAAGFRALEQPVPETGADLLVVLERPDGRLTGRVLAPDDQPVPGARVAWGDQQVHTDEAGRFLLAGEPENLDGPRAHPFLTVLAEDWAPLQRAVPLGTDGRPSWPSHLDLRLEGPPARLTGQVVDALGSPVPGAWVWLADPTVSLAGREGDGGTERLRQRPPGAPAGPLLEVAEWSRSGAPGDRWSRVLSDAEGRFVLEGLAWRPYRVAAMTRRSLVSVLSPPVMPGTGPVPLRLSMDARHESLSGRVLDRNGQPLAGVDVSTRASAVTVAHTTWIATGRSTRTDAEGRFTLGPTAASDEVTLRLDGAGLLPLDVPLPAGRETHALELVAHLRQDLRVALDDPGEADSLRAEARDGTPLPLYDLRHDRRHAALVAPLLAGRSAVLSVSDQAARVVLLRAGQAVRQVALTWLPGQTTAIH